MADISKITLPNGSSYNFKDATARSDLSNKLGVNDKAASAKTADSVAWANTGHPATFPPSAHNHDDRYYTESEINSFTYKDNRNDGVGASTDFNSLTSAGTYKVQMASWGDASKYNSPNSLRSNIYSLGILMVFKTSNNDSEHRMCQLYMPHNAGSNTWCYRWHNGSDMSAGWSSWMWLSTDANTTYDLSQYVKTSDSRLSDARKANGGTADAIKDAGDGRTLKFAYSVAGMNSTSWLGSWDGSTLKAISPDNVTAGNSKKVNGHTVGIDVPANAKFTDTNTWDALKGATTTADGSAGYAPAPAKGTNDRFLRSDGTWNGVQAVYNENSSRIANGNVSHGDGKLRYTVATSSMTTGKPPLDAKVLQLAWDNTGGWDGQIAQDTVDGRLYTRTQNSGTWKAWASVYDTNHKPTAGDVGALASNGTAVNAQKVNNHSVNADVPANAKFTDTTYSAISTTWIDQNLT